MSLHTEGTGPALYDLTALSITSTIVGDTLYEVNEDRNQAVEEVQRWIDHLKYTSDLLKRKKSTRKGKITKLNKSENIRGLDSININELFDDFISWRPWHIDALYNLLGLQHYGDILHKHFVTGDKLLNATEVWLGNIGVTLRSGLYSSSFGCFTIML
jgi:hypothetical protein